MSDKKPIYKFKPDQPAIMLFADVQPFWSGENKWGSVSYGYNVTVDGVEYSVFATAALHRDIQMSLGQGENALTITKKAKMNEEGKPMSYFEVLGMNSLPKEQKFIGEMQNQANEMRQSTKDELITRTAIVKSMIESGAKYSPESLEEAEKWIEYVKTGKTVQNATEEASDEIKSEDIPF